MERQGLAVRWRGISMLAALGVLFWLTGQPARAQDLGKPIVEAKVIIDSTDCGTDWTRLSTDLQMGSGALDRRTFYLCYRRGDGTPLTSVYPVSGLWFENRDCDDGDQRVSSTNLNSGSIQEDYLCASTRGQYPLVDLDVTTVLKSGGDADKFTLHRDHRHGRDFNTGFIPLLYIYDRDVSQLDDMVACGGEGEQACPFFSNFFWQNGNGGCDRGLAWGIDNVCHNGIGEHARHTTEVSNYLSSTTGAWADWALANQRDQLDIDEPINWVQFIHTHNSYNNYADGYVVDPNHRYSISDQLRLGSRWLDLDVHPFNGHLQLCHGTSDGTGCAPTDRVYYNAIKEIAHWLDESANRDEILVISLEDYATSVPQLIDPLRVYLGDRVYKPGDFSTVLRNCPTCNGATYAPRWPTRRELLASGKRVIVMDDNGHAGDPSLKSWMWNESALPDAATQVFDTWTNSTRRLIGVSTDANDFDVGSCGGTEFGAGALKRGNPFQWGMIGEDRTIGAGLAPLFDKTTYANLVATDPTVVHEGWRGLIGSQMAIDAVNCGATKLGYDMLGGASKTQPTVCGGDAVYVVPADACPEPDARIKNTVWSWQEGDRGSNGTRALLNTSSARWVAAAETDRNHFACGERRTGDPSKWQPVYASTWKVTNAIGAFKDGDLLCHGEFGQDFSVPVNPVQNAQLVSAVLAASSRDGFDKGSPNVWLNYLTTDGGKTWQTVTTTPSGGLNAWRADDPTRQMVAGVPVTFTPYETKNPGPGAVAYRWLFGDGESASGPQVNHTYHDPGNYTVTLVMDNGGPLVGAQTAGIAVANTAPQGALWVADGVDEGSAFVVQFLTSLDAVDTHATTFSYQFDCGDGFGFHALQTTPALTCPTEDSQTRTVHGRIFDVRGGQSTSSRSIPVRNVAPTAVVNLGPDAMDAGQRPTLSVSDVRDPSKPDTAAGFTYDFDCGQGGHKPSSATSLECLALGEGTRQVSVVITDKDGGTRTYAHTITVNHPGGLKASIDKVVDDTGVALQPGNPAQLRQWLTLSATLSARPDDTVAASISWGDGTRDSPLATGTATHWYDQPGDYTVTLTATGKRDTYVATQHVTVVLPITALNQANDALDALTTSNAKATSALAAARAHMRNANGTGGALPLVAAGRLQDALQDLMSVEEQLGKAHTVDPTLNVGLIDHQLAHAAEGLVKQQIDQAINTTPRDVILKARDALDRGQASLTAGDEVGALRLFQTALGTLPKPAR